MGHNFIQCPIRIDPERMIDRIRSDSYDLFSMRLPRRIGGSPSAELLEQKEETYKRYPLIPNEFLGYPGIRGHPVFPQYKNMPFRKHDCQYMLLYPLNASRLLLLLRYTP